MKQKLLFIGIALLAISMQLSAQFSGGAGVEGDPYLIGNANQLNEVRNNLKAHYKLTKDIDLEEFLSETGAGNNNGQGWEPIGKGWEERFEGSFDGDGKKILNLWIDRPEEYYVGLFSVIASEVEIKDLTIDNAVIRGKNYVGGLAGTSVGTITSCRVSGGLTAEMYVGGMIGSNEGSILSGFFSGAVISTGLYAGGLAGINEGTIDSCSAEGRVTTTELQPIIGGLVGLNEGVITTSHAAVTVETDSPNAQVGGLLGRNNGKVTTCYATGVVTVNANGSHVGGLVGYSENEITSCFATGAVAANGSYNDVGGLVGGGMGTISTCYSTGTVTAEGESGMIGGLIGLWDGTLTDSYSLSFVKRNAYAYVGGLIGVLFEDPDQPKPAPVGCFYLKENVMNIDLWGIGTTMERLDGDAVYTPSIDEAPGVTPLTSAQMTDKDSFTDWDFRAAWKIEGEENSPSLIWQQENHPVPVVASWLTGKGTEDEPFLIYTAEDLAALRYYLDEKGEGKFFSLEQDINLKDFLSEDGAGYNYRQGWDPIGETRMEKFSGTFLGNGKKIQNLWINRTRESYVGLFSAIASGAEIKDLTIELAEEGDQIGISGDDMVGGLAGANEGVITSCRVFGTLKSKQNIGGLTGVNEGTITACSAEGRVTTEKGNLRIGGLVGSNEAKGIITTSHAAVTVETDGPDAQTGGLLGRNHGKVTTCYATGAVTVNAEFSSVGGLVGYNDKEIASCFATGAVTANGRSNCVGGLVGVGKGTISTCYSMGTVTAEGKGSSIGGLIGILEGTLTDSYSLSSVEGNEDTDTGGLVGMLIENRNMSAPTGCFYLKQGGINNNLWGIAIKESEDGTISLTGEFPGISPLNDLQMTTPNSFTNWDFTDVWTIKKGQTAPYFPWQSEPYPVPALIEIEDNGTIYHTITLTLDAAIHCNYATGELSVAEGDHLYLQFQPEDATRTAADVILLIDGVETTYNIAVDGCSGSYILSPIEGDHTIEIRWREDLLEPDPSPDTTGTHNPEAAVRLYTAAGQLTIETPSRMPATVYTLTGQLLRRQMIHGATTFSLPNGVYIVCVGETTYKVGVGE